MLTITPPPLSSQRYFAKWTLVTQYNKGVPQPYLLGKTDIYLY